MPICIDCLGTGEVYEKNLTGGVTRKVCPICEGTGEVTDKQVKEREEEN